MTPSQRANISRGMRKSYKRRRMSAAMKAVWAQRKANNTPAVDADVPLIRLYNAVKELTTDFEQLKAEVVNEFSIDELIHGLMDNTRDGTHVQDDLRKFLNTQIENTLHEV